MNQPRMWFTDAPDGRLYPEYAPNSYICVAAGKPWALTGQAVEEDELLKASDHAGGVLGSIASLQDLLELARQPVPENMFRLTTSRTESADVALQASGYGTALVRIDGGPALAVSWEFDDLTVFVTIFDKVRWGILCPRSGHELPHLSTRG